MEIPTLNITTTSTSEMEEEITQSTLNVTISSINEPKPTSGDAKENEVQARRRIKKEYS